MTCSGERDAVPIPVVCELASWMLCHPKDELSLVH